MTRYRIPRRNGLGEDILDTGPIMDAIEALQQQVAANEAQVSGMQAQAEETTLPSDPAGTAAAAVAAHVAAANPHSQYLLSTSFTFTNLGGKPTTLAGYGITDAASATHQHSGADITSGTVADARLPTTMGSKTFSGEVISTSANSYRVVSGSYGAFWRQDGASLYLLLTASGDPYGGWNTLRPFCVTLASGDVLFGQMTRFNVVPELLNATGAAYVRVPRIFVGGSDPGATAAEGDLWIT